MAYDEIPTAGRHPGDDSEHESGANVRAPAPPKPGRYQSEPSAPSSLFRVAKHKTKGTYRVRAFTESEMEALDDDYEEIGRYDSQADLSEGLSEVRGDNEFVVFEGRESGEVQVERAAAMSGNWTQNGRYDQFTLFESEDAAAQYADKQQA